MTKLLLASSSPYRRELMQRLGLAFSWASPDIDESRLDGEPVPAMVERLAEQKAQALATTHEDHIIIGSDQAASLDGQLLTKPGGFDAAVQQLLACSGRTVAFYTGLCVRNPTGGAETRTATTTVSFRELTRAQIEYYIRKEQPLDCAGSFKCEGLGISLFESISSDDPTALIGLPLTRLTSMLARAGLHPLEQD